MKKIIYILIFILFTSCSIHNKNYSSDTKSEDGFPLHGNFCGKNIPTIKTQNIKERLKILNSIEPIDDIDLACKQHDICYAKKGYYNSTCDQKLINTLYSQRNFSTPACRSLARLITSYFYTVNPKESKSIPSYAATTITNTAVNGLEVASSASVKATKYFAYSLVVFSELFMTPFEILEGNNPIDSYRKAYKELTKKDKYDDAFDVLPDRYTKCYYP